MSLPPEAIDEFMALWKEQYGEDISRAEASQQAHKLVNLLDILTKEPKKVEKTDVKKLRFLKAKDRLKEIQFDIEIESTKQASVE